MNVTTLQVSRAEAETKLAQYRRLTDKRRTREDEALELVYKSIAKGARCLNLAAVFKQTGLNERYEPRLAIARADWPHVHCFRDPWSPAGSGSGTVGFSGDARFNYQAKARNIVLPNQTYTWPTVYNEKWQRNEINVAWNQLRTAVPHIPPSVRPNIGLHNFHVLLEVQKWDEYNVDPFLLRRIVGWIFFVVAEWELTPLEASLIAGISGN
jgi:hypothetical protein